MSSLPGWEYTRLKKLYDVEHFVSRAGIKRRREEIINCLIVGCENWTEQVELNAKDVGGLDEWFDEMPEEKETYLACVKALTWLKRPKEEPSDE